MKSCNKRKECQRIKKIKIFDFENTSRSDVKRVCCDHWGERRRMWQANYMYQPIKFTCKKSYVIDFTDEQTIQCDVPVVKNAL